MPDLDEFIIGPGGDKPAGSRFKLDDFMLEIPAQAQAPANGPQQIIPPPHQPQADPNEMLRGRAPVRFPFGLEGSVPVPSSAEAALITAGETASKAFNKLNPESVQQLVNQQRPSTEGLRDEFPVASAVGDTLPALAVPGGPVIGGAVAGAALSEDELTGAIFGAAGGALGALGSRIVMGSVTPLPRGIGSGLSKESKKIAKELGVTLDLGDLTGNKAVKNAITAIKRNPLASGPFDVIDAANTKAFNTAALRSIGVKGDKLTAQALEGARVTLSEGFESVGKRVKKVEVSDGFLDDLAGIIDESRLSLDANAFSVVESNVNTVLNTVGGVKDGRALSSLSSSLGKRAMKLTKPGNVNTAAGDVIFELKELVDNLFEANAGPGARRELTELRKQWSNLRTLRSRNVVIDGDVQLPSLRSTLQTKDPDALLLGGKQDNELFKMARLQESVRELVGNSGTPTGQAFDPGNIITSLPQRAMAKALNDPVLKLLARNNLLPKGLQDAVSQAAARAAATQAATSLD